MRGRSGGGRAAAALCALLLAAPGRAAEAPPAGGPPAAPPAPLLTFCAPPVVPACIDGLKGHPEAVKGCAAQAELYEASVFAYRVCLSRETERAVREANAAMGKVRCAQGRRGC